MIIAITSFVIVHLWGWLLYLERRAIKQPSVLGPFLFLAGLIAVVILGVWWIVTTMSPESSTTCGGLYA